LRIEGRDGAGHEGAGSDFAGDGEEDHVVASGFFIIVTNAWMQHPVAYRILPNGVYDVTGFWGLLTNPWALVQYAHNMSGAVITAAFAMCAVGAFYVLENQFSEYGKIFLRVGVIAGRDSRAQRILCPVRIFA
jgi:cytochrome bd-type quinol oxidase subunit 1